MRAAGSKAGNVPAKGGDKQVWLISYLLAATAAFGGLYMFVNVGFS
ncbi:hypothetical protein B4168_0224 [Anoxybacillus flavithermus]|nr:hypothetical protein B4168_0224 [Anoxybacillus flavithermus]OAO88860.1 hypothetical protein GT23_0100 [Parageobacillus thermoglucosidasius]